MKIDLKFDEATNKWVASSEVPDNQLAMAQDKVAEMGQAGMLAGLTKFEVAGIPIGAAAAGGALAFVVDYAFDRFLPTFTGSIANLVAAWAVMNFGSRWVGRDVAKYAATFLAYEAVRDMIEPPIARALGSIGGPPPIPPPPPVAQGYSAVQQAQSVAEAALGPYRGAF